MKKYSRGIILILIISLIVMGYFLWQERQGDSYHVWIASEEIALGSLIQESMIKQISISVPLKTLGREEIVGKTATIRIPEGSVISAGLETPYVPQGNLVNIPVTVELAGLVQPGDDVELIGISHEPSPVSLGFGHVVAMIDSKGKIYRHGAVEMPVVLVVEVPSVGVQEILAFINKGVIYPILGGTE